MSIKKFPLLTLRDIDQIAKETNYNSAYARQVIRGYVKINSRNQTIIDLAIKLHQKKMSEL